MKSITDYFKTANVTEASDYFKEVVDKVHNWAYEFKDEKETKAFIAAIAEGMRNAADDRANDKTGDDEMKATEMLANAAVKIEELAK